MSAPALFSRSAISRILVLALCACLTGCTPLNPPPPQPPAPEEPVVLADPNAFGWETEVLEAEGTSSAVSPGGGALPQLSLMAKNSAKAAALVNLEAEVRRLPVNEEATIGAAMDAVISVQRGVKRALQRAEVTTEEEIGGGSYRVRVRLALAPIAEVLRQNYITPANPLPEPPGDADATLGPIA